MCGSKFFTLHSSLFTLPSLRPITFQYAIGMMVRMKNMVMSAP